jgi:hypothetical protein
MVSYRGLNPDKLEKLYIQYSIDNIQLLQNVENIRI